MPPFDIGPPPLVFPKPAIIRPATADLIRHGGPVSAALLSHGLRRAQRGYLPQSEALFAAMTTPPTEARKALYDAMIGSLLSTGVWTKLDILYIIAAADNQAARLNLMSPGNFTASVVSTPTFTTDRGYTGDGSGKHLNSGWDRSTNGVAYTQNSASLFTWNRTNSRGDGYNDIGTYTGGADLYLNAWNASLDNPSSGLNSTAVNGPATPGNASGLFTITRVGSSNYDVYRNTTSLGTNSAASAALNSTDILVCHSPREIAAAGWGGGLTSQNITDLYNALNTYLAAVGAA